MDLLKAIRELQAEKKRLTRVIASLEEIMAAGETGHGKKKKSSVQRGRKSMSAEERRLVSERMAKYWAARRAENAGKPRPT